MISIEEFKKLEIKIGKILSVEKIPETEKLLKLSVDLGEESPRQIISGIAPFFENTEILVGKKCAFASNLEPRVIKGFESQGMILAVGEVGNFSLLEVSESIVAGSAVK